MIRSVLLILLTTASSLAQPQPIRQLGIGLGLSLGAGRFEGMSQLIQRGKAFPIQAYFLAQGQRSRHFLQLQSDTYLEGLRSAYGGATTNLATGYLQYGYHHRLSQLGSYTLWLGGLLTLQATNTIFTAKLFGSTYQNSQAQTMLNTASLSGLVTRPTGRGRLEAQLALNAISYNLRPDYAYGNVNTPDFGTWLQSGTWESLPAFGQLNARLAYDGYVSAHLRARLAYQWQYWRVNRPRYMGLLTNQVLASLAYQF